MHESVTARQYHSSSHLFDCGTLVVSDCGIPRQTLAVVHCRLWSQLRPRCQLRARLGDGDTVGLQHPQLAGGEGRSATARAALRQWPGRWGLPRQRAFCLEACDVHCWSFCLMSRLGFYLYRSYSWYWRCLAFGFGGHLSM